jgi:hypothetical protein
MRRFFPKFLVKPPNFAAAIANRHKKVPNLPLQSDSQDTPLP